MTNKHAKNPNQIINELMSGIPHGLIYDERQAQHMGLAVNSIVTEFQETFQAQKRRLAKALWFANREYEALQDTDPDGIFLNLDKLLPEPMTLEEYLHYPWEIRQKYFDEFTSNEDFLAKISLCVQGVSLAEIDAWDAQNLIRVFNPDYNYFVLSGRQSTTYQGAPHDPPFSTTEESRRLRHSYLQSQE